MAMIAPDARVGKGFQTTGQGRQRTTAGHRPSSVIFATAAFPPSPVQHTRNHELFNGFIMLTNSSQPAVKLECENTIVACGPGLPSKAGIAQPPSPRNSRRPGPLVRNQMSGIRNQLSDRAVTPDA